MLPNQDFNYFLTLRDRPGKYFRRLSNRSDDLIHARQFSSSQNNERESNSAYSVKLISEENEACTHCISQYHNNVAKNTILFQKSVKLRTMRNRLKIQSLEIVR